MKHLVAVLAVFLLMGSQTLAQEHNSRTRNSRRLSEICDGKETCDMWSYKAKFLKRCKEFGEELPSWMDRLRT